MSCFLSEGIINQASWDDATIGYCLYCTSSSPHLLLTSTACHLERAKATAATRIDRTYSLCLMPLPMVDKFN